MRCDLDGRCWLMRPVFISYATADRKDALTICEAIERRGTRCWIACRDVQPGENYQEAIVAAIRTARALVLVFSDEANNSDEIKKELSLVSRYRLPLMALRIEDVEPSDAFAYELATRQWIDLFVDWDKSLDGLVRRIDEISPPEGQGEVGPTPAAREPKATGAARAAAPAPVEPASPARFGRRAIAAIAVLVLVAAVAAWFVLRPGAAVTHPMEVRLAGFQRLSPDLPATLPDAMGEEVIAAFSDDGVVGVSTAKAQPPGTAPAYALGGTVRRDADKIRVVARVTNERSSTTLWSNSFSYDAKDVGRVPRRIAVDAGNMMRCALFAASTYPKAIPDTVLKDFLQFCHNSGIVQFEPTKALHYAKKVVAALPDFSWGWSAVANGALYAMDPRSPVQFESLRKEGLEAAAKALRLDHLNSEALATQSMLIDQSDLAGREALLQQALKARPLSCGCEHQIYANMLQEVGRMDDAIGEYRRATDVLALEAGSQLALGAALLAAGRPEEAKPYLDAALDLATDPNFPSEMTVEMSPVTRDYAAAVQKVRDPKAPVPAVLREKLAAAFEALMSGNPSAKAEAAAGLASLPPAMNDRVTVALLGALGSNAQALKAVEAGAAANIPHARRWLFAPSMAGARADPAFPGVAQRLGLIKYWRATKTRPDFCAASDAPPLCRAI